MTLILAIEPDPRQAAVVKDVITRQLNAEALMTVSKDAALAALASRLPDILLVTTLLSPRDESEITDSLRTLDQAGAVPMLTIPLLVHSQSENETSPKLLKAAKRRRKSAETSGCEPSVFAGQIRSYLECAKELRAEWQARQEEQAGGERETDGERREAGGERETEGDRLEAGGARETLAAEPEPVVEETVWGSPAELTHILEEPMTSTEELATVVEQMTGVLAEPTPIVDEPVTSVTVNDPVPVVSAFRRTQDPAPVAPPVRLKPDTTDIAAIEAASAIEVAPVDFAAASAIPAIEMSMSWVEVLEALTVQPDLTGDLWDQALAWCEQPVDAALTAALVQEPEAFVSEPTSRDELWQALFESPDPTPVLESFVSVDPFVLARGRAMSEGDAKGRSADDAPEPTLVLTEAESSPAPKPAPPPEARMPKRRRAPTRVRKALPLKPVEPEVYELPASLESMDRSDGDDRLAIDVSFEPRIARRSFDAAQGRPEPVEGRQGPPVASSQNETISTSVASIVPLETPSATLKSADAEWMARELDVLRARVEQLQAEREAQAEALRDGMPRKRPSMDSGRPELVEGRDAAGRPIDALKSDRLTSPRRRRAKPITDEWGIHDPDRCGFTALFARLDALDAQSSTRRPGSGRPESIERRTRDMRSHPHDHEPVVSEQAPADVVRVPKADLPARGRRSAAVSAAPRLSPLAAWARTFRPSIVERGAPVGFSTLRNRGAQGQPLDRQQGSPVDDCTQLLAGLNVPHRVAAITFPTGCRIRRVRVTTPPACPTSPQDALVVILSRKLLAQLRQQSRVWYHAPASAHEQIA